MDFYFYSALLIIFIAFYVWYIYIAIFKKEIYSRQIIRRFHNAIINIQKKDLKLESSFSQLKLNYEKLNQFSSNSNFTSILDLLETIVYYYDTYSDYFFQNTFRTTKRQEVRDFVVAICGFIRNDNPFISSPPKEADLMRTLKEALDSNNSSLGMNSLLQLSKEIETKEKLLKKKDKENQIAIIVSIVGIVLTVFFGLLSLPNLFR